MVISVCVDNLAICLYCREPTYSLTQQHARQCPLHLTFIIETSGTLDIATKAARKPHEQQKQSLTNQCNYTLHALRELIKPTLSVPPSKPPPPTSPQPQRSGPHHQHPALFRPSHTHHPTCPAGSLIPSPTTDSHRHSP